MKCPVSQVVFAVFVSVNLLSISTAFAQVQSADEPNPGSHFLVPVTSDVDATTADQEDPRFPMILVPETEPSDESFLPGTRIDRPQLITSPRLITSPGIIQVKSELTTFQSPPTNKQSDDSGSQNSQPETPPNDSAKLDDALAPIGSITANIKPAGDKLPKDYSEMKLKDVEPEWHVYGTSRPWLVTPFEWEAAATCYYPLYFEDINLERNGHSFHVVQPAVSAGKFFGTIPILPYLWVADCAHQCKYTLGHYRPGSRLPYEHQWIPLSISGSAAQTALIFGLLAVP